MTSEGGMTAQTCTSVPRRAGFGIERTTVNSSSECPQFLPDDTTEFSVTRENAHAIGVIHKVAVGSRNDRR